MALTFGSGEPLGQTTSHVPPLEQGLGAHGSITEPAADVRSQATFVTNGFMHVRDCVL